MPAEGSFMMEHSFAPLLSESVEIKGVFGAGFKTFKQNVELDSTDCMAYWKKRCLYIEKEFSAFRTGLETILDTAVERHSTKIDQNPTQQLNLFESRLTEIQDNIQHLKEAFSIEKKPQGGNNYITSLKSILSSIHMTKCEMNQRHFAESNLIQDLELQAQHLEVIIIPECQPQLNPDYPYKMAPAYQIQSSESLISKLTDADNIRLLNEIRKELLKPSVHKEPLNVSSTRIPLIPKTIPTLTRTLTPTSITRKSSLTQQLSEHDKDNPKLFKHLLTGIHPLKHRHSSPMIDPRKAKSVG